MNEQYLQDLYGWIKGQDSSYEGRYSYDQFKQKMQDEGYATQMHGWISSVDETFGQRRPLTNFVQQVKLDVVKPAQPEKKNVTASPSGGGGSELTKFDPRSGQIVQETPSFDQPSVKPQAPQQPKPTETIMYGPMGAVGIQRTKEYKPEYEGKSIPKVVGELGKTFAKGVVKFPADVLETAAIATAAARNLAAKTGLVDETSALNISLPLGGANVNFFQAAGEWKDLVNEYVPTDKDVESGFWGQTASALGQMVPVILTGGISGGGRAIAKEAGKKGLSMQAVANYGKDIVSRMGSAQGVVTISQVAAPSYEQAKLEGATENEALGFAVQNAVMTFPLEMLPVNNLFKRLDNVLVGNKGVEILKRAVVGGAEEGITEGIQNIYENVTADAIYGTTRTFLDGVGESTAVGGTVGGIMSGLLTALLGRRARATSEMEIEQLDKSIEEVQQKVNQVESNNKAIEKTIAEIEESKPRVLSYGSANYNFIEAPNGELEYTDDALNQEQAQGVVNNLSNSYKKIDFVIEEVEPEDPYKPTTYKIIGKPKTIQQDAIQEQAAGQVPVQSGTGVSQEVAQGEPQAEPQVTTQEGQAQEVVDPLKDVESTTNALANALIDRTGIVNDRDSFNTIYDIVREGDLFSDVREKARKEGGGIPQRAIAEKYHESKANGTNPDFVQVVENAFIRQTPAQQAEIDTIEAQRRQELEANKDGLDGPYYLGETEGPTLGEVINQQYDARINELRAKAVPQQVQPQMETPTQQLDLEGEVSLLEQLLAQEETAPTASAGISVSSDADVETLRTKTRSQQATTQEEKDSVSRRVKIIDTAKRAINTLRSVFPDVDIVIHDDEGSYNAAMLDAGGVAGSRGNFFSETTPDGKTAGRIDINLSKANARTVAHEIAHGILLKSFGDNVALFNDFRTRISKVLKGDANKQLNDFVDQYIDPATGELLDVNHEEFLAELTGMLEQQETNISVTTMQKVAALINEFVSKITGGKFKPFEDTKNTKDVVDFFNTISGAIREGGDIELNGGGEVGTFNFISRSSLDVKDAPSSANDSRSFIRDLVQDVDMIDFNGRKFVTNMYDYTNAGVTDLGNGLSINMLGGKNYVPYMMSLQGKKIGDVSNLAAFNTKAQAESFARNAIQGQASLFAPHSGTLSQSWQFQQHTFAELVNLIIDNNIMSGDELIDVFNKTIASNNDNKDAFNAFKSKLGKDISNFDSFKNDPKKIVDLLDIKNNYSPNLRKALNNSISADKTFQKAIGIKNKQEFFERIMDPLNDGVQGGEIINVVEFDPKTFKIVQTKAGSLDHHPSFGWSILSKINGIYQPTKFYQSSNVTESYVKYNKSGEQVSRKAEESNFEKKNVSSSAGSIPKVAEFNEPSDVDTPSSKRISRSQINDSLSKASGTTQVATTTGSYSKAANILKSIGIKGDVLDYGAGLGLGTDAMSDVLGKDVESLEINPERWKGRKPVKYTDANQIDKKYDGIVSLNVVNVVPKEIRDFIVLDIFNNLKEGGTAIISSRGFKGDINQAKNFVAGPEEKSYIIKRKQDGETIDVFQKGYDGNELVEYVQGLLGESALVIPNNTFGNKGVVITKLRNVKSKSQLPDNIIQKIIDLGRANGLSEAAISTVLQKRGFTTDVIDTALGKQTPAAKKVEVTEEFAPGYDRVINNMFGKDGIVAKSRGRGVPEEGVMENAIAYLVGAKVYENATDVQREQMVRNLRKEFKKREKAAPSAEKVVGKPKKKQVTVDEMAALKDQIKLEARAAREAKGDLNTKRKALAARIIAERRRGLITAAQARALVNRISKVNLDNPIMVDRLLEYTDKVFDDANYAADMADLKKLQKQARSRKHTSMKDFVDRFTSINPELIPLDRIQDYKEALDFLNNRTPSYARMNEMLPEIESYQVSEEFDSAKTMDGLMSKYESIALNEVNSVEEYVDLIKDINSFKRKAFQLLQNEAITQEEYDNLIDMVGKDQTEVENRYKTQISELKRGLIAEIKKQRPKVNAEFTKEENGLIKEYLELSDADLESLSPEDLFILNDLLDNISNGEIDYYRFKDVVSKAASNKAGVDVGKQLKASKLSIGSAELRKKMAQFESSFWEGLLGLGRATSGPLQKFIVSPFNRAIGAYEKFIREGYNDFLNLKNKYKIDDSKLRKSTKQMSKIGMLTTYLQEYMAQFDPKNKGVDNIGKRDWFKVILATETMRDDYSPEELKIIEEIHEGLPKDKDGNVDPEAVYNSYMANDGKFFTKNEKGFFDAVMEWKKNNSTSKQKAANEMSGNAFNEIPFHMLRSRYAGQSSQITPTTSGDNGMVRIKAGTGKERASEAVGAINTNFEKLFIKGLEQTGRDYFLSKTLKDINNVLKSAKKELAGDKDPLVKAISFTLSDALAYEFSDTASQNILKRLVQARAAMTLFDPIRAGVEFTSTLLSFGLRARTLSGYKKLFGSQVDMRNLLEFTDSPLRLRQNINNAIDINDGRIEPQGMLMKATTFLSGLPERTMMVTSWMPTFTNEFQKITKEKFDMKKFNDSEAYREKYGKAIKESSAVADAQTEKIIGPTTKAGQRRDIIIFPGKVVGRDTVSGQILGFFSNYPYREITEFINGFKEAGEVLKKGDTLESIAQLQKPLGIALNVVSYGFLSSVVYASRLILLGDEDEEERGNKMLEELITAKGFIEETAANAAALAASKYAGGGRATLQILGTLGMMLTDNEETKATIKKMLKGSVYVDPLPTQKLSGFGTADEVNTAILKYIPQFVVLSNIIIDGMGGLNEVKTIIEKVESKGVEALTKDEELRVLALSVLFTGTQLFLNYRGSSLPSYNTLKASMKSIKEEAGVADIAAGKVPAKKKSSGGTKTKPINKTDMKRYFPEQYEQMYGEGSPGYEIQQQVKEFEKEQRELKKKMKDQIYGVKD